MYLIEMTVTELLNGLRLSEFNASDIAESLIAQSEKTASLGALSHLDQEIFRSQAVASDKLRREGRARLLEGIPIVIKDNIDTDDMPTTAGTGALRGCIPTLDAPLVARLRSAGAVLPAKAAMHELAFGATSNNGTTGPARNPYNASLSPGGSSGGTASSVAARQFPAGIGTDTGASVRLPAALCGLYGFRPSVGRYPGEGIIPVSRTRDTAGAMARSLDDILLLDALLAGQNQHSNASTRSLNEIRLGIPRATFWSNLEPGVADVCNKLIERLQFAGVTMVEVNLAEILDLNEKVSAPIALYEVMQGLPAYLEKAGYGIGIADVIQNIGSPDVKEIFLSITGNGAIPEAVYKAAAYNYRPAMQKTYMDLLDRLGLDGLVFPTSPMTARPLGEDETVELNGMRLPTFAGFTAHTDLGSNLGAPGISLPAGLSGGLPVGIEIDGRINHDCELLAIARQINALLPTTPRPATV